MELSIYIIKSLRQILLISRPRLWIYTLGSFLLGIYSAYSTNHIDVYPIDIFNIAYIILWLTIPANLFLYALNDAFDFETDAQNPRKEGFELKAKVRDRDMLIKLSIISILLYVPMLYTLRIASLIIFLIWILTVITYNVPPLRLKAQPLLDNIFALNYPLWGVFGYHMIQHTLPSTLTLYLIATFAIIMHIYSASSDIEFDKKSGVITTAVQIGSLVKCLVICLLLTGLLIISTYTYDFWQASTILAIYFFFFLYQILSEKDPQMMYRYYLRIHYLAGFAYFILVL